MTGETQVRRQAIDNEHLRLLAIFHYVYGGLTIAFSLIFVFYIVIFSVILTNPDLMLQNDPEGIELIQAFGKFIIAFFALLLALGISLGIATIYSGRCINRHRHKMFSIIIAAINCLSIPFGTLLGVFTIIVLSRESVRTLYAESGTNVKQGG